MRVYYAHSKSLYGTPQEKRDIATLELLGFEVTNPAAGGHEEACKTWTLPMDYFIALAAECDIIAFRAYPSGLIGVGVYKEITTTKRPVIELPSGIDRRSLTLEQTRSYLKELGQR